MDVWPQPHIRFTKLTSVEEKRPTALLTSPSAWEKVGPFLNLPLLIQAEPNRNDVDFVLYLATNLPAQVQVIYAVGDGLLIDIAKVVASSNKKPLVIIPTAIDSDAAFSSTATVRENDSPRQEVTGPAAEVIIDMDIIASGPAEHRASGIVDVLAILTGLMDWAYAEQKQETTAETRLVPWAVSMAAALAGQALKSAALLGHGDHDALRTLVSLLSLTVQLDSQLGHRRASEGIEHWFAMSVKADPSVSYAEKVGVGIIIASALNNKDVAGVRAGLEAAGVRLDRLNPDDIRDAVYGLPEFAQKMEAPYSILNELQPNAPELAQALLRSGLVPAVG